MLKAILASEFPLSIYEAPESKIIRKAMLKVDDSHKLEDILISEGNFRTIKYIDTVQAYNSRFHNSEKVFNILKSLGDTRNIITHFGIDRANDYNETIILFLNTFDVIYNYLYPQLIKLDGIGHYFTSDGIFVETIHGYKHLYDENNNIYNNIVDFLDELLEDANKYISACRAENPKYKIGDFTNLMYQVLNDKKMKTLFLNNNSSIDFSKCDFKGNNYQFTIYKNDIYLDYIYSSYSSYFNVTSFCGECGNIYFLVVHDSNEMYIYYPHSDVSWPEIDEPESDYQWRSDLESGYCFKTVLSKRNLIVAFNKILT